MRSTPTAGTLDAWLRRILRASGSGQVIANVGRKVFTTFPLKQLHDGQR